jgi:acetolactate decarboxylase
VLEERQIRALHVEALRRGELLPEHEPHVLFQASTIGALLEGAYEGDLTLGEVAEHGDLGLGTTNGLDGELIVLDGRFYRADIDGRIEELDPTTKTPFAVVTELSPSVEFRLEGPLTEEEADGRIDQRVPEGTASCALRIDGSFERVRARSVPRQTPPYRPLTDVVAEQHVFEFENAAGTMVGFRFPDYAQGIEVAGYHLHFITEDRQRGGHVLSWRPGAVKVQLDPSGELHMELPPGVELASPELGESTREALARVERDG